MADTKVSGLTAAGSFLDTHEFPVNEAGTSKKVTGLQILARTAQGTTGWYAAITANFGTYTTQVDVTGLTITQTTRTGRRYRLSAFAANAASTITTDTMVFVLMEGATQLQQFNSTSGPGFYIEVILTPTAASHTYKLQAYRAGTGNATIAAAATSPAYILLEDIGT